MTNIIVLDNSENFLTFLDPELLDITETFENSLRSIEVTYDIDELTEASTYFKEGNKIWISGGNLTPCLYVLNTPVKKDIYQRNTFTFDAEEVLVELNYAPFFTQTEVTKANGFTITTENGQQSVTINYNALKYWFGDYFNIGIVQDCISTYISQITVTGTMSLMSLLRYIEEETGNVFVTRYEKDILTNTIHRYLDFLNPHSQNKNWECNFEYDFIDPSTLDIHDENNNPIPDPNEDVYDEDDIVTFTNDTIINNLNPETLQFRFTDGTQILTDTNDNELVWNATDCGLTNESTHVFIRLTNQNSVLGVQVCDKTFKVDDPTEILVGKNEVTFLNVDSDPTETYTGVLPTVSYFEFYDTGLSEVVYQRVINPVLNVAHEEILDLGYNVENIELEVDESDTYTAISPVLGLNENSSNGNGLSRTDLDKLIKDWINLGVEKNTIIPMIVQKINVEGTSLSNAKNSLGTLNVANNYFSRPLKPSDNTDSDNKSYEFWRATAYWRAPFTKNKGEMFVTVDSNNSVEYPDIRCRPDTRHSRATTHTPKMGQVETSDENKYAIYNAVAMKLKDKKDPVFNVTVDVANFKDNTYNDYNVHDKVYVKLPGSQELVIAEVVKTVKDLHNIAENKVTLGNYSINSKEITKETYIDSSNINFKYPNSKKLTATLKDSTDENVKLKNKVLTFTLYKIDNGSSTLTKKVYAKKTDSNGQATITCKYDPGDYELEIAFGGDAEYTECSMNVEVSVGGTKEVKTTETKKKTKSKTTKSVKYTWKTEKTYYDKYGRSPDKKTIVGVGLPSRRSELNKYGYRFMKTVFKNKCPVCGKSTLYYGWNFGTRFRGRYEGGSYEGHFFCDNCDADFSAINGENHNTSGKPKMTKVKAPVKSSKSEAQNLIKGKLQYGTKKVKVKVKKNTSTKTRTVKSNVNSYVKKKALSIVGDSTGFAAIKKICKWMDKNIKYHGYYNFQRSAKTVLQRGGGNCCDGTRLFFELCDAAGCTAYAKFEYIHVSGHVYAKVTSKSTGNQVYVDSASNLPMWNYICRDYRGRSVIHKTEYPTLPF